MKNTLLKGVGVFLTVAIFLLTLVGCSTGGSSSNNSDTNSQGSSSVEKSQDPSSDESSQSKVTLTIEASQEMKANNPYAFYQYNIDAFEEKYPNITVKMILDPDAQAQNILQTKLAAGQPSDIINYNKVSAENELNVQMNFVDLSEEPWVSNLTASSALLAPDGKIYGFALKNMIGGMGIVYNKDIFEKLDVSVPKTYDQFVEACETIKANGINPIFAPFKDIWTFQMYTTTAWGYYVAQNEPDLWDKLNSNEVEWTEIPAFLDSLTKLYSLYENGYMQDSLLSDDYNGAPNAFLEEKNAMMMGADVTATDLMTKIPEGNFGLFPLPLFEGESEYLTIGQLDGVFFIPKKAKHIEEAKKFLNFLAQPEQIDAAQEVKSFMPSISGAEAPEFNSFEQEIYTTYNKPGKTVSEMNVYMKVDLTDLWKYYQDMFAGQKTPGEVLEAWNTRFEELMKEKDSGF